MRDTATLIRVLAVLLLLFCHAFADSAEDIEPASLAVLVDYDPEGKDFAEKLQPLLETEATLQWDGKLVERAELNKLLDELKLTKSGLSKSGDKNTDGYLQLGRLIRMDCLLTVKVTTDDVKATVTLFPSTTIIHEKIYRERLQPHPLAVGIVTDAIKAAREHNRDPNIPQLSIGSFFYTDPHRQFFEFSRNIGEFLRQQLVDVNQIVLTERLLPSQLVSEFELARGGFIERMSRRLSAPASDILLYGQFQPKSEQDLTSQTAVLDFTLFVVSPTGLCENRKLEFSCHSGEPEVVAKNAMRLIEQAAAEVRAKLSSGEKRNFSEQEFESFKKQAFRLMPTPPLDDGDFYKQGHYRGPTQFALSEELKRAFHMLECAMLFKGDDTQVLVCIGAVLEGLSRKGTTVYPRNDDLLNAGMDLIERAYYLDSNWNTRGMYWLYCMYGGGLSPAEHRPSRCIRAARQIWNTRKTEPWHVHEIRSAFSIMFESQTDIQQQYALFLQAAPEYEKQEDGLRELFNLFSVLCRCIYNSKSDPEVVLQTDLIADSLLTENSLFLQSLGHLLHLSVIIKAGELKQVIGKPSDYVENFNIAVNMLPDLHKVYGKEFTNCSYSVRLRECFDMYEGIIQKHGLRDNVVELKERYISSQMKAGNYNSGGIVRIFRTLLPVMWECGWHERACELVTEFLDHYTVTGSADYERMWLARERNRLIFAMNGKTPLGINQIDKVEFDDDKTGWVTKLVTLNNDIYGIRSNEWFRNGQAFQLSPREHKAQILSHVSGEVSDIACAGSFVGIGTRGNGFYLINNHSLETSHFAPENSGLPGQRVTLVCTSQDNFYLGVLDKENLYTIVYLLEPDTAKISLTNDKFSAHTYWQMKPNTFENQESCVIPQTWYRRTTASNGPLLEFSCSRSISAVKDVTVNNTEGVQMLQYRGFELSYVFDFVLWQDRLLFATGNGLYVSEPGSNEIHCLISEPDLLFFSLCPLNSRIYLGTSNGLYCLGADRFLEMTKKVE